MKRMIALLLLSLAGASVERWFARQPAEWARAAAVCEHIAVMFGDERWLDMTLAGARELRPACAALWLWIDGNTSAVPGCAAADGALCYVDRTSAGGGAWGTVRYFNKIAARVDIVRQILLRLPLDARRGVALVDSDIVFFRKNALARFEKLNRTLVVQQELPCWTAPRRLCANGGLWWLRRVPESRALLAETVRLMQRLAVPDQDALDIAIATTAVDTHYLDARRFANGWTFQHTDAAPHSLHLVHLNWMSFAEKLEWARRLRGRAE